MEAAAARDELVRASARAEILAEEARDGDRSDLIFITQDHLVDDVPDEHC